MESILNLEDWHYFTIMSCAGDEWRLTGRVENHPTVPNDIVHLSSPVHFDKENMLVTTFSGRKYKLGRCFSNLEQQIKYIEEDVLRVNELQKHEK